MSKHRSLSNALLTPEKLAFIKGDNATTESDPPPEISAPQTVRAGAESPIDAQESTQSEQQTNARSQRTSKIPTDAFLGPTSRSANDDYLVAITTRLQARTADALRQAYLEQKLNRREPATQQEIIEAALQTWLRKHDYLP